MQDREEDPGRSGGSRRDFKMKAFFLPNQLSSSGLVLALVVSSPFLWRCNRWKTDVNLEREAYLNREKLLKQKANRQLNRLRVMGSQKKVDQFEFKTLTRDLERTRDSLRKLIATAREINTDFLKAANGAVTESLHEYPRDTLSPAKILELSRRPALFQRKYLEQLKGKPFRGHGRVWNIARRAKEGVTIVADVVAGNALRQTDLEPVIIFRLETEKSDLAEELQKFDDIEFSCQFEDLWLFQSRGFFRLTGRAKLISVNRLGRLGAAENPANPVKTLLKLKKETDAKQSINSGGGATYQTPAASAKSKAPASPKKAAPAKKAAPQPKASQPTTTKPEFKKENKTPAQEVEGDDWD